MNYNSQWFLQRRPDQIPNLDIRFHQGLRKTLAQDTFRSGETHVPGDIFGETDATSLKDQDDGAASRAEETLGTTLINEEA